MVHHLEESHKQKIIILIFLILSFDVLTVSDRAVVVSYTYS